MPNNSERKLFFGLFIFPLLIAVGMAVMLCTVVLMTYEQQTPESLLESLKKSSPAKRWQKAFELSNEINRHPDKINNPSIRSEMIQILKDTENFDVKTRGYMALALARHDSDETFQALRDTLKAPEDEIKVYSLWSLGILKRKEAAEDIELLLTNESAEIRKIAAYVLGAIDAQDSVYKLKPLLKDESADVRWNAALAMARLGSGDGYNVLISMLERETLSKETVNDEQLETVMINATKGLVLIQKPESIKILKSLSEHDKSLRVRQAALNALQHLEKIFS